MGQSTDPRDRLIVALDAPSLSDALALADRLAGTARWFKIGPHLFTVAGPAAATEIAARGRLFLDLKFHDIPSTVAAGVAAASRLGASLCNVHALGGSAMMAAARTAARDIARTPAPDAAVPGGQGTSRGQAGGMRVIAVTLVTSADAAVLAETGLSGSPREVTLRLARLAQACGLDGVVSSPLDAAAVRETCGDAFLIVCPGVRPRDGDAADQRRVLTPREAMAAGADLLVVGRPITHAPDPAAAAARILDEMAG